MAKVSHWGNLGRQIWRRGEFPRCVSQKTYKREETKPLRRQTMEKRLWQGIGKFCHGIFYAMTEEQSKGAQLKSMTKRVVSLLLALILALGFLPAGVLAAGETEVSDQNGLAAMTGSGSYLLTQDITLNNWNPINFSGTLDGNGHTITLDGQPLFGALSGTVKNLCLDGEAGSYDTDYVGALAFTLEGGTVNNCWSGVETSAWEASAGFIGTITGGTIKNCLSTYGSEYGISTDADSATTIKNCYYSSDVWYGVSDGDFTDEGNSGIGADQYLDAMAQLNAAHEEGLLYWVMDTDGVPKPISSVKPEADRTELNALYEEVKDKANAVPDESSVSYTSESWTAFETARTSAKEVLENQDASQAAIDKAKNELQAAIDGLIPDRTTVTAAEREALQAEIAKVPSEKGRYTDASWSSAQTALKQAKDISNNPAATAEDLTQQTTALQTTLDNLTEIADPAAVTEPPEGQEWQMISTAEELAKLSEEGGTGYYKLSNDIINYEGYYSWNGNYQQFNGVLDGNGYAVIFADADKYPNPVINALGPNGVIQNLGVKGSIANVPIVNKLSGMLINCYSWAESSYGGLVGEMCSGSVIANCYVNKMPGTSGAGGLVYTGSGGHILNSYWPSGEAVGSNKNTAILESQTVADQKAEDFRRMLNAHRFGGIEWHQSELGFPWLGEEQAYVEATFYPVAMTDVITGETTTITSDEVSLTTSVFGLPGGDVATLEIQGYDGGVEWDVTSAQDNSPIIVYGEGRVWVRAPGTVTVTATCGDNTQSFQLTAEVPKFELKLKINGEDYTGKTYQTPGSDDFALTPYVIVDGREQEANDGLFTWESNASDVINVDSTGWVNVKQEGSATLTASLGGVQASVTVEAGYIAATDIQCNFSGTYYLHRRNPNSIGQTDFVGADFNPLRNTDENGNEDLTSQHKFATITPSNATYQTSTITSDNDDVIRFVAGTLQCMVPRKAGTAHLTVTSSDPNLSVPITDTEEVTLEYLNPVTDLTVNNTSLTVQEGQTIDAGLVFTGANDNQWPEKYPQGLHVSESDMTWTQSGDGQVLAYRSYPIYMPGDEGYSLAEGSVANDQWLIKGVKAGTVTLTGTAKDTTNGTHTVTLTIHVQAGEQGEDIPVKEQVSHALQSTGDYVYQAVGTPSFNDEWMILGLARSSYAVSENFYETYYAAVCDKVQEQKQETSRPWDNKVTETQRLALALTAIGKDPTDVGGVNLLDYTWNKETYFGQGHSLGQMQGSNELIFGLLALEASSTFSQPASVTMTADAMVDTLLSDYQTASGGFGLSDNQTAGADITAMALQGLAKHTDEPAVSTAISQALDYLSSVQSVDGTFGNAETTAQVVLALCELNMDPDQAEAFTKNGCSVVDGLLSFALEDGSFCHTMTGGSNGMATEQAFYALAALDRFYNGQNSLYRMDDVTLGGESGSAVTGVTVTPASAEVETGQTVQLTATVVPVSAENKAVTWKSSDPQVASVSNAGLVTGQKAGTAQITVTTEDGGKTAVCQVTVRDPETPPPGEKATVTLSVDKLTIDKGYVLEPTTVEITVGETVWEVFQREMENRGIPLTYTFHTQYNSVYVESIDGDGEFDHGPGSGWKYCVDGVYPDYGCSLYTLSGGEVIQWRYTTNLGADLEENPDEEPEEPAGSTVLTPEAHPDQNGSAQVPVTDLQLEAAISGVLAGGGDIVLAPQISGAASEVAAQLPIQGLKTMVEQTKAALVFQTELGDITLSHAVLSSLVSQAKGNTVRITLTARSAKDVADHVDNALLEGAAIVEVTIACNGKLITAFGGNGLTIALPVSWADHVAGETYRCVVVHEDGTTEEVSGTCSKERGRLLVALKTSRLSTFVVTTKPASGQESSLPFFDATGHWALDAITYVWEKGLMNGTGKDTFSPESTMTRAMMVTILYRMAGSPAVSEGQPFSDVPEGTWYTQAVSWAASQGIVDGVGEGRFSPDTAVTREQMAVLFYRYGAWAKLDVSQTSSLAGFTDCQDIHSWALEAMEWAHAVGLITGRPDNRLAPQGTATRGEAATILMRFAELGA